MVFRDRHAHKYHSRRATNTSTSMVPSTLSENEQEEDSTIHRPMAFIVARTPLLILDYVQFKAARTIQRHWRGFHSRKSSDKRWLAATTIQRWWRGFFVRKNHVANVEQMLQNLLTRHYNKAATKIQALWRGWWIRQTVHDMNGLHRMQACAAEDLLSCVAFKLHHLLRTYSIPGVYSIRNTHCLSRIEKLMSSINFRFLNGRVYSTMLNRQALVNTQRKRFNAAPYYTEVPFPGPNFKGACKPQCDQFMKATKDIDRRMYKIIDAYDKSQRDARSKKAHYNLAERKRRKQIQKIIEQREKHKCDFCGDVIASMRRWKIWDSSKFTVGKDIFRSPKNLEKFLDEVFDIVGELKGQCHCNIPVHDVVFCH